MDKFIVSCEHYGNAVPEPYQGLFKGHQGLLKSHRGWDIGAKSLFEAFSAGADAAFFTPISRLVIECNRSPHHPYLFSEITKNLSSQEKKALRAHHYEPYRDKVFHQIEEWIKEGKPVFHLSVHTFTPFLGEERRADIGLLYDPKRKEEKDFCKRWKGEIYGQTRDYRVRYNYPYKGTADGFIPFLRKKFPENYWGVELEVNNKWADREAFPSLIDLLVKSMVDREKD